jgi:Uroporphyrinogen-III decarboxylase
MKLNGRERLLCALNHKEGDCVPIFEFLYSRPFYKEVLGYVPKVFGAESIVKCSAKVGYDFVIIPMGGVSGFSAKEDSGNIYTDEWGITYEKNPGTWPIDATIDYPMKDGADWLKYSMPDPGDPKRYDGIRIALDLCRENKMGVIGNMRGPFSASWMLFGMEKFYYLMYDEPETVDSVLTSLTDFAIAGGLNMAFEGVDALLFSDDYGSNSQPLLSPSQFRRFIAPQIRRLCLAFKHAGIPIIMHSDGHVDPLVDDCVNAGIKGIHPIERCAGMDIAKIKKLYGDRLCLFGNIDNKELMTRGTPADIEAQVKECMQAAARGGGYCLGSDHSIHDDIPNENVFAIYEAGRKFGSYPIML